MQKKALTRKQEGAIIALLSSPTMAKASEAASISEATVWRWLQDENFQTAYRRARATLVEAAMAEIQAATTDAVKTLKRNLTSGKPGVEVRAAVSILDMSMKAVELHDLEERLGRLERLLVSR